MAPLITAADVEARLGRSLSGAETTQVEALIDDASGLVRDVAAVTFEESGVLVVPAAVVGVVAQMVIRAVANPRGLTGETIGDYSWQAGGGMSSGVYATRNEKRTVRLAAGRSAVAGLQLSGDLPIPVDAATLGLLGE